jgi:hypothetical protein
MTLIHGETGILSVEYMGQVKAICDDGFGEADATVACTELYGIPDFYTYS